MESQTPTQTQIDRAMLYRDIRQQLVERLTRMCIPQSSVAKMSLYQIIGLLHLMAGHINYLPTFTLAVRTVEELVGDQLWERLDSEPPKVEEPQPQVVH
jgi:hypothetical protein